jgi:hypothetical protein
MHVGGIALSVVLTLAIGTGARSDPGAAAGLPTADVPSVPGTDSLNALANAQLSGGPRPDGIPAIDDPRFFGSMKEANRFLDPGDIVFGIVRNGEARAYPQRILVWHEIVNDVVGGEPLAITYCPLTGTAIGFKRGSTTFGVSGMLVNSNLVMFDRATGSRWPQILGRSIEGDHAGNRLEEFPVIWTTWERWRQAYPETRVLSDRTGFVRNYDGIPMAGTTPWAVTTPVTGHCPRYATAMTGCPGRRWSSGPGPRTAPSPSSRTGYGGRGRCMERSAG